MTKRYHPIMHERQPVIRQLTSPFLAFTVKYSGYANRIITPVRITTAFDPSTTPQEEIRQYEASAYDSKALWDTGATNSVVTEATVAALGLVPIGNVLVNHAGGCSTKNRYLINVLLPNKVAVAGVMVSDMPENTGDFGILIGMDIISQGDLSISNVNNLTCMSFRIPAYEMTDYVVASNRIMFARVPRNKPCPCGSKDSAGSPVLFKNCHGKDI